MSAILLARHQAEEQRETAILEMALELLLETGFEAMSMDALARRARVGKATLYGRWGGKPALVVAAVQHAAESTRPETEDHGSLREDLLALGRNIQDHRQRGGKLVLALAHAIQADTEIATAAEELLRKPAQLRTTECLTRAIERGEIQAEALELPYVMELLPSLLIAKLLFAPQEVIDLEAFVDLVLIPILTHPTTPVRSTR
jgi:AcrR family transcriptional regulator